MYTTFADISQRLRHKLKEILFFQRVKFLELILTANPDPVRVLFGQSEWFTALFEPKITLAGTEGNRAGSPKALVAFVAHHVIRAAHVRHYILGIVL